MAAREVTRVAEDVVGVEDMEVAAITEDTAEDAAVAERGEIEEDTEEAEEARGDSMMIAEKTGGMTDHVVEAVDAVAAEATEGVVEVLEEEEASRMATVNKLECGGTGLHSNATTPPRYQIAKTDNNITNTTPSDSHNKLRFTNSSGHSIMINSKNT